MKYYFQLQYKMLFRHIKEFGLHPVLAYVLIPLVFLGLSFFVFYKTIYAPPLYSFIALMAVSRLSERNRNDFLKSCFFEAEYTKVRLLENGIVALPFLLFLLFKGCFLYSSLLLIGTLGLAVFKFENRWHYSIPTPFSKHPFEFVVAFRMTFPFILLAYFLVYMAIVVTNFPLGLFSFFILFLVALKAYAEPESRFFVWIFSYTPKQFLGYKLATMLGYFTLLCVPVTLGMSLFFFDQIHIILGLQALVSLYVFTIVLAKYSTFPKQNNLPEALLMTLGVFFPPALLVLIPFFYQRAIKRLNTILV